MITQEVNAQALAIAAEFVVGPEATAAIGQLYRLLDRAMYAGYEIGKMDGEAQSEARSDAAFDTGYDTGYLDGVGDARARPAKADEVVAEIVSDLTAEAFNGEYDGDAKFNAHIEGESYDANNVQDSGDETTTAPYCVVCQNNYCTNPVT